MGLKRAVKQILIDREHRKYEIALKEKSLSYDGWIRKQEENNIIKPNICEKYRNYLTTESEKETYDGYEMENEGKRYVGKGICSAAGRAFDRREKEGGGACAYWQRGEREENPQHPFSCPQAVCADPVYGKVVFDFSGFYGGRAFGSDQAAEPGGGLADGVCLPVILGHCLYGDFWSHQRQQDFCKSYGGVGSLLLFPCGRDRGSAHDSFGTGQRRGYPRMRFRPERMDEGGAFEGAALYPDALSGFKLYVFCGFSFSSGKKYAVCISGGRGGVRLPVADSAVYPMGL